jgi:NADH dehydrogenase/NADH:ubiquinone oxidoreductase subunit G
MAIDKAKRKKMEDLIYQVFDALDPTKSNSAKYRQMFSKMSDAQFDSFFKQFFANPDEYLVLDVTDYERDLRIENVEKAAKILDVPLFEKVAMPFVNKNPNQPILTKYEVPVGYVHIKRVQQILSKKNTTSTETGSRSALTGQVVGRDKNARDSDTENFALVTIDATDTLRELMGPRADDMVMKNEMYAQIAQKGFVSLQGLPNDVDNKVTLNAVDVHLIGMGIKSDLVTDSLAVKKTLNR